MEAFATFMGHMVMLTLQTFAITLVVLGVAWLIFLTRYAMREQTSQQQYRIAKRLEGVSFKCKSCGYNNT